jgi:hypothetical protein
MLNEEESAKYQLSGKTFIQDFAGKIQGNPTQYFDRNITSEIKKMVNESIDHWWSLNHKSN